MKNDARAMDDVHGLELCRNERTEMKALIRYFKVRAEHHLELQLLIDAMRAENSLC